MTSTPTLIASGFVHNFTFLPGVIPPKKATHLMRWQIGTDVFDVFVRKLENIEEVWENNNWKSGLSRNVAIRRHKELQALAEFSQ